MQRFLHLIYFLTLWRTIGWFKGNEKIPTITTQVPADQVRPKW